MLLDRVAVVAGGREDVFDKAPQERARYVALGMVILATGVFAAVSATFALHMALEVPAWLVAPVGVIWGVTVIGIDRALIFSISRRQKWWTNLLLAIPRLAVALLLGAIISTPLVLQILHAEIDEEIGNLQLRQLASHNQQADAAFAQEGALEAAIAQDKAIISAGGYTGSVTGQQDVKDAQDRLSAAQAAYDAAAKAADCEANGDCGSGQSGKGPIFDAKEAERRKAATALQDAQTQYDSATQSAQSRVAGDAAANVAAAQSDLQRAQQQLLDLQERRRSSDTDFAQRQEDGVGLLERYTALNALTESDAGARSVREALLALFALIEITPIFTKIVMVMTDADKHYHDIADEIDGRQLKATRAWNKAEDAVTAIKIEAYKDSVLDEQERRKEVVREANATVAQVQRSVVEKSLRQWRDSILNQQGSTPPVPRSPMSAPSSPIPSPAPVGATPPGTTGANGSPLIDLSAASAHRPASATPQDPADPAPVIDDPLALDDDAGDAEQHPHPPGWVLHRPADGN